jgi:hypothetical protein
MDRSYYVGEKVYIKPLNRIVGEIDHISKTEVATIKVKKIWHGCTEEKTKKFKFNLDQLQHYYENG